jgi:hypothetical protein
VLCPHLDIHLQHIRLTRLLWSSLLRRNPSDGAEEERVKAPPAFASAAREVAPAPDARGEGGNGSGDELKGMRAEIEKLRAELEARVEQHTSSQIFLAAVQKEKGEAQLQVERLQTQALGLMDALNEQNAGGVETEQLTQQLAEKDEQLKIVRVQLDALQEQARTGSLVDALKGRREEMEALQEELEMARSEVGVMKDMVRQGEGFAQEVDRLKHLLAERAEQCNLANIQLEALKAQMRGDGGGEGAEVERQLKQQLAERAEQLDLANIQLGALKVLACFVHAYWYKSTNTDT